MKQQWTPFLRAEYHSSKAADLIAKDKLDPEVYINNLYQVSVLRNLKFTEGWPVMTRLSIKRRDRKAIHDWRDLQRIKNELIGPNYEALELYPSEGRLVDTANQYWIWVFDNPEIRVPFGFQERWVSNVSERGTVQRPFPLDNMPSDCKDLAQYLKEHETHS